MEEEYWRQRGRVKWALQGDANTAYFHAVANGRRRKCTISSINLGNEITNDPSKIQTAIYDFYRDLLGSEGNRTCSLSPRTWPTTSQVSLEDNNQLMITFTETELDFIVREMKSDTAPGPDGFPVLFFKRFWPNVKLGVLHILNDFMLGRIDISCLNFAILTLIPKVPGADLVSQFRPIALINVIFKIVSKAFAYRLDPIAHKIISLNQTAFIKGRNLLEGPLALIEIVHELRSKRLGGILLKLDFEKAYDRVNWEFLAEVLRCKGFEEAYIHRILQLVSGGQTAIAINGVIGPYFRNKRGVRQGDPLSPLLFNFIGEALSGILSAAGAAGHIQGVVPHLITGGISHLQYADDTLILIQNSEENIANLKFLLMCFEDMSGLKINYHKSEVIVMGQPMEEQQRVANKLNCKRGSFPFMYLGLPISDRKLRLEQWLFLVRKLAGRIEPWLSKLLTSGGRLILSNACLDSIPIFAMGLFLLHDGIHARFDSHRSKFFWEGAGNKRKYHMVNWPSVCRPKSSGGLGLLNSKKMNIALLSKWIWKLYQDDASIWATIIRAKYRDADNLFEGSGQGGSQFWKSLHKIKHFFKLGAKHLIGNGRRTFFWTDWWCQDRPIKEIFPDLFNICADPNISVAAALESGDLNIVFRRSLNPEGRRQWDELGRLTEPTVLSNSKDKVTWHLDSSGKFTVQSLYAKLSQGASVAYYKDVWEAKVPLKIKIFAWQLILDRLPSSQQIATRHGPASGNCALCGQVEDAGHIFFACSLARFAWSAIRQILDCNWNPGNFPQFHAILSSLAGRARRLLWFLFLAQAWALWNIRNKLTIEKKVINHPANVIFKTAIFIQLWSGKAKPSDRDGLRWLENKLRELYTAVRPEHTSP
jgi:hypothetical protein